jgi:hypothetical protein
MESVTLQQLANIFSLLPTGISVGVLYFSFKIYKKIERNDALTKVNLKATKVMLDQFISDKVGNGEFKAIRAEIDEALIYEK